MSFSEDPSSAHAPFTGDSSGQIFDLPDMVSGSPTTSERVVDTQSGFLLVVKKLNDRLALSIKRNVGTPPSSSVSLTQDESSRLSRILASSFSGEDLTAELAESVSRRRRASKLFASNNDDASVEENEPAVPDFKVPAQSLSSVHIPMKLMLGSVLRAFMIPILGIALSVFALGIGAGVTGLKFAGKNDAAPVAPLADPLEAARVDAFVRDFVANMLDFTSNTYRISQIHAMASMSPDLLERYWSETSFPLSKKQLQGLPQSANLLISELKQERIDANSVQVDIHAKLCDTQNPKLTTPVNLRLKLALDANRQIFVLDQEDLSAAGKTK